jgi:hypothetical protein
MIEEQIEIESLPVHFERDLAANESEAPTKLQKKVAEMNEQTAFQFAFFIAGGQSQEIKLIGVFQNLFS